MKIISNPSELDDFVGLDLGLSDWMIIDQSQVDTFAELTDDRQWVHVDTERARQSPFGTTIVHGYLTLAFVVSLARSVYRVDNISLGLNYGLNKVRFPAPTPVGSRVRLAAQLLAVTATDQGGRQAVVRNTITCDRVDKPVCVAETVTRYYPKSAPVAENRTANDH